MNLLGIVLKIQTFASAPNDSFNLYFVKQRKMIIMDNVTGFSKCSADIHVHMFIIQKRICLHRSENKINIHKVWQLIVK